jgi:hypothetical protein
MADYESTTKHSLLLLLFYITLSGVRLSPLVTAATTGLLCQPRMIDDGDVEQLVE